MTRRIIQISTAHRSLSDVDLYALCNDGTVWLLNPEASDPQFSWVQLPSIPQPPDKPTYLDYDDFKRHEENDR